MLVPTYIVAVKFKEKSTDTSLNVLITGYGLTIWILHPLSITSQEGFTIIVSSATGAFPYVFHIRYCFCLSSWRINSISCRNCSLINKLNEERQYYTFGIVLRVWLSTGPHQHNIMYIPFWLTTMSECSDWITNNQQKTIYMFSPLHGTSFISSYYNFRRIILIYIYYLSNWIKRKAKRVYFIDWWVFQCLT